MFYPLCRPKHQVIDVYDFKDERVVKDFDDARLRRAVMPVLSIYRSKSN